MITLHNAMVLAASLGWELETWKSGKTITMTRGDFVLMYQANQWRAYHTCDNLSSGWKATHAEALEALTTDLTTRMARDAKLLESLTGVQV